MPRSPQARASDDATRDGSCGTLASGLLSPLDDGSYAPGKKAEQHDSRRRGLLSGAHITAGDRRRWWKATWETKMGEVEAGVFARGTRRAARDAGADPRGLATPVTSNLFRAATARSAVPHGAR